VVHGGEAPAAGAHQALLVRPYDGKRHLPPPRAITSCQMTESAASILRCVAGLSGVGAVEQTAV
jgi:hypothetical protein